jgi:hypothetical protein
MGVEKISFCSVESQSFLACSRPALIEKGNSQADLAQCQGGRTVNETSAAEEAGENRAQARNLPPAEAAWNGESWNTAAQRDHADQETKNNKRLRRLVLSKRFALARLRVAFLRASLIREDIRAVGLALAGDLITPEQALDRFDDIMQPELS